MRCLPRTYNLVAAPWEAVGGWRQAEAVDGRCWLRTPPERAAGRFVREGEGYAAAVKLKLLEAATAGATEAALAIVRGDWWEARRISPSPIRTEFWVGWLQALFRSNGV